MDTENYNETFLNWVFLIFKNPHKVRRLYRWYGENIYFTKIGLFLKYKARFRSQLALGHHKIGRLYQLSPAPKTTPKYKITLSRPPQPQKSP